MAENRGKIIVCDGMDDINGNNTCNNDITMQRSKTCDNISGNDNELWNIYDVISNSSVNCNSKLKELNWYKRLFKSTALSDVTNIDSDKDSNRDNESDKKRKNCKKTKKINIKIPYTKHVKNKGNNKHDIRHNILTGTMITTPIKTKYRSLDKIVFMVKKRYEMNQKHNPYNLNYGILKKKQENNEKYFKKHYKNKYNIKRFKNLNVKPNVKDINVIGSGSDTENDDDSDVSLDQETLNLLMLQSQNQKNKLRNNNNSNKRYNIKRKKSRNIYTSHSNSINNSIHNDSNNDINSNNNNNSNSVNILRINHDKNRTNKIQQKIKTFNVSFGNKNNKFIALPVIPLSKSKEFYNKQKDMNHKKKEQQKRRKRMEMLDTYPIKNSFNFTII